MPELPTGTVTFLFTDVEGSTKILQGLGRQDYGTLQDQHAAIVRAAIEAGHGVVIRTEGDSFFAVFPTPSGALRAAVQAQRQLAAFPWKDDQHIRVRMGVHTGEGSLGGDDYLGIDVNLAARIEAAGHGGQVVISDATRTLVMHTLPEGVVVRNLGTHRLKDIEDPVHLHDLVVDGLVSDFPVLRSLRARRTNLPAPRTSFVGRDREIVEVGGLLDTTRLLTITGPGGTGKTRLALQVASGRLDRYPDGVHFVDLSSIAEPAFVVPSIARAFRLRETPGRDLAETLRDHLAERELLLVLDNLEHLVAASPAVGTLLDAAPGLTVLATSRIPLRLSGEQQFPLAPLALPTPEQRTDAARMSASESVRLFVDRAAAVRPGFQLTDEDSEAVATIVSRLDGLPLALELAASRLRVLSPDALAARLEQRLPLLVGGATDAPERQRTLEATIAWSHDLLDLDQQRLFARLSVFAGGWTLEAAEAVCGAGLDVLDDLGVLVDESLVRRTELEDGALRFTLLETIREFATRRLEASEADELEGLRRRHAGFFEHLAGRAEQRLIGEDQLAWIALLDRDNDNFREALSHAERSHHGDDVQTGLRTAAALWRFWLLRGQMAEGRARLERLLDLPDSQVRNVARSRALRALGSIAYWQTDYEHVAGPYEEAVEIAREVGDRRALSWALYDASFASLVVRDDPAEAERDLRESLAAADEGDPYLRGRISADIANMRALQGDFASALDGFERALILHREAGDSFFVPRTLLGMAGVASWVGDVDTARKRIAEATDLAIESANAIVVAGVLHPNAWLANKDGRHRLAARLIGAYERIEEEFDAHIPQVALIASGDPLLEARAVLGMDDAERARAEGNAMSLHQILELISGLR